MTTVAIKDGLVAVDSQLTGESRATRVQKLMRLPDGGVVAAAGTWRAAYAAMIWVVEGEGGDPPELGDVELVIVRPDHSIWVAENVFPAYPIVLKQYALGSGADLVHLLMSQGESPVNAVFAACEHDTYSSGPVYSMQASPIDDGLSIHTVKPAGRKK